MNKIYQYLNLIRVRQWHKNAFVLLGFLVYGHYNDIALLQKSLFMFTAFCLASSAVYVLNDYLDIEADRNHPEKKERPLAKGTINVSHAFFLATTLCVASITISYAINFTALIIILLYLLNNITYTYKLKEYPIVDVFQIGLGFMFRIFAGTAGIGIYISEWMILTGFMVSLLIGFAKRFAELSYKKNPGTHREVLQEYSEETLKSFMIIMASATIITYSLYTLSPRSVELHPTTPLIYTSPLVIFGIMRFLYLVMFHKFGDDPASQLLKDKQLIITVVIWALLYGLIIS